jgi:hypothetical protein
MRSIVIHVAFYALDYVTKSALLLGFMGIVNRLFHKPFFDRWRRYLSFFTIWVVVGWLSDPMERKLFDRIPSSLHVGIGVVLCLVLLTALVWVYVRYLHPGSRLRQPDTSAE